MRRLLLSLPSLGERAFLLDELDGHAERLLDPDDPRAATRLLGRLLLEVDGEPVDVASLLCAWRDRVLAALFERELGGRIQSTSTCEACGEESAFAFDLAELVSSQDAAAAASGRVDERGRVALPGDTWVRLPTLGDLATYPDPEALAAALGDGRVPRDEVEAVLDEVAPALAADLEVVCASCEHPQLLRFDIVRYTVESLAAERPLLIRETHLLASRYGWGHDTIMSLSRSDRRAYAALVLAERTAATGLRSVG